MDGCHRNWVYLKTKVDMMVPSLAFYSLWGLYSDLMLVVQMWKVLQRAGLMAGLRCLVIERA